MNQTTPAILLTLLAVALPFASARGGIWNGDPNLLDPNGGLFAGWEQIWKDSLVQRHEVMPWLKAASLPSPDNAALLYYQAFLFRPERDDATYESFDNVLRGGEPDSRLRLYLRMCRDTIRLAEMAGQIPQCTWAFSYPDGEDYPSPVFAEARQLSLLLAVDTRTLAFDGYGQAALARCLTIRQLARHLGDDTLLAFFLSLSIDGSSMQTAQYVLGVSPPETSTLKWLRGQLAAIEGTPRSPAKALQTDFEFVLDAIANDPVYLELIKAAIADEANGGAAAAAVVPTDEEILTRAREPYAAYLSEAFRVLDAEMVYEEKYRALENLTTELVDQYGDDPATGAVILWTGAQSGRVVDAYALWASDLAAQNALKTAVEIYLVVATTRGLPESLPANVPKDPFSGQDFEYEITDDRFILRCRASDLRVLHPFPRPGDPPQDQSGTIHEYEFKVLARGDAP